MKRNGFECALISYSGALIMDRDRTVLYSKEIERGLAERIEQFFVTKAYDMSWCIYSGDDWLSPDRSDPRILREESIVEAQSREGAVKDLAPGRGVNKFLCICAPGGCCQVKRHSSGDHGEGNFKGGGGETLLRSSRDLTGGDYSFRR